MSSTSRIEANRMQIVFTTSCWKEW